MSPELGILVICEGKKSDFITEMHNFEEICTMLYLILYFRTFSARYGKEHKRYRKIILV